MEKLVKFLKRKSRLEYELNSMEKYIKGGDYDKNLKTTWENYQQELKELDKAIALLSNPETKELEEKRLELLEEASKHKKKLELINYQIKSVEKKLLSLMR